MKTLKDLLMKVVRWWVDLWRMDPETWAAYRKMQKESESLWRPGYLPHIGGLDPYCGNRFWWDRD